VTALVDGLATLRHRATVGSPIFAGDDRDPGTQAGSGIMLA
jgi:hypothetical protein